MNIFGMGRRAAADAAAPMIATGAELTQLREGVQYSVILVGEAAEAARKDGAAIQNLITYGSPQQAAGFLPRFEKRIDAVRTAVAQHDEKLLNLHARTGTEPDADVMRSIRATQAEAKSPRPTDLNAAPVETALLRRVREITGLGIDPPSVHGGQDSTSSLVDARLGAISVAGQRDPLAGRIADPSGTRGPSLDRGYVPTNRPGLDSGYQPSVRDVAGEYAHLGTPGPVGPALADRIDTNRPSSGASLASRINTDRAAGSGGLADRINVGETPKPTSRFDPASRTDRDWVPSNGTPEDELRARIERSKGRPQVEAPRLVVPDDGQDAWF